MKVAATDTSAPGFRSHAPVPLQAPLQPANADCPSTMASRCTGVSRVTENQQVPRQSPCNAELRTAPGPDTATVTVAFAVYWLQAAPKTASTTMDRRIRPPLEACAWSSAGARADRTPARPSCGSMRRALAPRRRPTPSLAAGRLRLVLRLLRADQQSQRAGPRLRGARPGGARHLGDRNAGGAFWPFRRSGARLLRVGLGQRQGADLRR